MTTAGPYAAELVRRVRAWSVSSWRHGRRELVVRDVLHVLAGLATAADGRPRPPVPDAGVHALPDQLEVLIADALRSGADPEQVDATLEAAAGALGLRIG